ncbi:MAG: GNAT family N-acetyltransferase [Gemmatimonadetes bacterium]|nr:GNAT family N-acetyltransferase [Gemmatimonadota bacterium]
MSSAELARFFVRPWSSEYHDGAAGIYAAISPSYVSEDSGWRLAAQFDTREDQPHRLVAISKTGQLIGYAATRYIRAANARIDLMVHPDWQRQRIGSELLHQILGHASRSGVSTAHMRARWDAPASLAFLECHGFAETHRMYGLRIDLTSLDVFQCTNLRARLTSQDIAVFEFSRDAEPSTVDQLLDLYNAVKDGWPSPESIPSEPTSRSQLVELLEERLCAFPDVPLFVATQGGRFVAFCGIRALAAR